MMTTSVNYIGLDPRQMAQSMQLNVNERTAAEEAKAEEQRQTEGATTPEISIGRSPAEMFHIRQAASAGILRPVWLEMTELQNMDANMPRMRDLISRGLSSEREVAPERAVAPGNESGAAEAVVVPASETERAVASGTARAVADDGTRSAENFSE